MARRFIKHPSKCLSTTAVNAGSQVGYDYYVTFTYGVGVLADNADEAITKASRSLKHDIDLEGVVNVMEYNVTAVPPKSVESSSNIMAESEYTSSNPLKVECPRGPYYVWEDFGKFKGSVNNPDTFISDARKVNTFDGFNSIDEVVEYVKKYF